MVRLSGWLQRSEGERKWYHSRIARVNISWAVLIVVGISSFVYARDDAIKQRREQLKVRKEVRAQVEREIAEREAAKAKSSNE